MYGFLVINLNLDSNWYSITYQSSEHFVLRFRRQIRNISILKLVLSQILEISQLTAQNLGFSGFSRVYNRELRFIIIIIIGRAG